MVVSLEFKCSHEALSMAAMLSGKHPLQLARLVLALIWTKVPNVWLRPPNQKKEADAAKALLSVPDGDHLTLVNVYNNYITSMLPTPFDWGGGLYLNAIHVRQIFKTKTGPGTIFFRQGHYPKQKMCAHSSCGLWNDMTWILSPSVMSGNSIMQSNRPSCVDFSCKSRLKRGRRGRQGQPGTWWQSECFWAALPTKLNRLWHFTHLVVLTLNQIGSCSMSSRLPRVIIFVLWPLSSLSGEFCGFVFYVYFWCPFRLLEHASGYYDLGSFPNGGMKRALQKFGRRGTAKAKNNRKAKNQKQVFMVVCFWFCFFARYQLEVYRCSQL